MIQQYGDIIKNINNIYENYDQLVEFKKKIQKSPESYEKNNGQTYELVMAINYGFLNPKDYQVLNVGRNNCYISYQYKYELSSELLEDVIKKYNLDADPEEIMSLVEKYKLSGEPPALYIDFTDPVASYSRIYVPIVTKDAKYELIAIMIKHILENGVKSECRESKYYCKMATFNPNKPVNIKGLFEYNKG